MESVPSITRLFGIELEFFLIDNEGKIANKADMIIESLKPKLSESKLTQECGKSMIEMITFPHRSSSAVFNNFFKDFETLLYELEVNDLGIYNFGTYPGKNETESRQDNRYQIKRSTLGESNWPVASKCIGFHFHYSLPRLSFNNNFLFFYPDIKKRKQEKVLNLYNLYNALDPAITTLMQSSPYYEGKFFGKDSRIINYRGDFGDHPQLYKDHKTFGILEDYNRSFDQLLKGIKDKAYSWQELLKSTNASPSDFTKPGKESSLLDSSWNPVKISPHGTIESRGSDMNKLNHVVAMSSLMIFLSRYVQNNFVNVIATETGDNEPFKLEDNELFVPTFEKLKKLENSSAFSGLEDAQVWAYCDGLLKLCKEILPIESQAPLRVFMKMLEDKKTVSDEIIRYVGKKQGDTKMIENLYAQEFAIQNYEKTYKDLLVTKKMAEFNLGF